jgi:D-alanyl-lipoteichoic acid acyltransferase DltB (MBOAT superfamily)
MVVTYFSLMYIRHMPSHFKRLGLAILLIIQFAPLIYYKYAGFISVDVFGVENDYFSSLIIPVGISFYTFQMVGFVIDYNRSHADYPGFLDCLNFASFFPQIVAGPIERKENLLPQVEQFRFCFSLKNVSDGCRWIILGLFLKLSLADNLADASSWIPLPSDNAYIIWLGSFVFGLRIYFDFAGYSLIALGLGRLFGIELLLNFLSPYSSTNVKEFWRRWHRSLSTWFRDYLYFPLGGGRKKWWPFSIFLVFVVSGIWHGAGWNFVLWGALHGALLIGYRWIKPFFCWLPSFAAWGINILFITLTWLFFYQTDVSILIEKLSALASFYGYSFAHFSAIVLVLNGMGSSINLMVWVLLSLVCVAIEFVSYRKTNNPYELFRWAPVNLLLAAITVITAPGVQNGFIYFSF